MTSAQTSTILLKTTKLYEIFSYLVTVSSNQQKRKPAFQSQSYKNILMSHPLCKVASHLQHCCCQCRLLSSLHSCRWGHSGTAGTRSVCPNRCRAERHRMASYLWKQTAQVSPTTCRLRLETSSNMKQMASNLQTVCKLALCHTELSPAAHTVLVPGTAINT